jgi:hypothetical protein
MHIKDGPAQAEQQIKDFGLVVALVTAGFTINGQNLDGRSVYFTFKDSRELQKAIEDYWSDTLTVNPRRYFDNMRMVKSRIHEAID